MANNQYEIAYEKEVIIDEKFKFLKHTFAAC